MCHVEPLLHLEFIRFDKYFLTGMPLVAHMRSAIFKLCLVRGPADFTGTARKTPKETMNIFKFYCLIMTVARRILCSETGYYVLFCLGPCRSIQRHV